MRNGYDQKSSGTKSVTSLDGLDKLNLQNKLAMDDKLRNFADFSTKVYSDYSNKVLTPGQLKLKIQDEMQ